MPDESELIKDKAGFNPKTSSNPILLDDHRILHAWWSAECRGKDVKGWSKEDIHNAHELAAQEMTKRKLGTDKAGKHASPLPKCPRITSQNYDQPFPAWKRDGELGVYGPKVFLPSILKTFEDDVMLAEDFISIVGGLCNHGSTKGDIDILIKSPEPHSDKSPLGMAAQFRLARCLAKIGIPEDRLQFLYDEFSGPFTNHVHVYDLVLRLKPKRELHEMSEKKSVRPFSFVIQPKPLQGRFKEQIFSPESVVEVIKGLRNWKEAVSAGVFVEPKFDGFRVQVHKVKDRVKIFTEENTDVTAKLPSIVAALKKIKSDFVAEAEGELWIGGKHQNRADANAVLTSKEVPETEKNIKLTFYDLMFAGANPGVDLHDRDFSERHDTLMKLIPSSSKLDVSDKKLVEDLDSLKSQVIAASKKPGSEGAMIKKRDYKYPLKPHTSDMIKFKNEFSMNVEVLDAVPVKDSPGTFNYFVAFKDGQDLRPAGKTFNTKIKASKGEAIEVVFVELNKNTDPKTKETWYEAFAPRVVGKADKADSVSTADSLVKKSGGQIQAKPFPTRFKGLLDDDYIEEFLQACLKWDQSEVEFQNAHFEDGNYFTSAVTELRNAKPPVLDLPEKKKPLPFVIQEHIRGKSSHLDFRLSVGDHLIGFTLDDPGRVGDPLRFSNDPEESSKKKVLVQAKARQPLAWLKTAGDIAPGEVGATRKLPAKFKILDSGTYEMGAQKSNFLEVFLKGKKFDGRFVFRKLPRPSDAEKAGKRPFVWFAWKPIKQRPFVLSNRSIQEGFVPPKGRSALPKEWEDKIPKALRWWEKGLTGEDAITMIKEIRKMLLKRNILTLDKLSFSLQRRWWKGQKVIRDMPVQHWQLNFSNGVGFDLDANPLVQKSGVNAVKKTITDKDLNFSGQLPPASPQNPNKKIPLNVEILDKGKVNLIESTDNFMSTDFSGEKLKGFWTLKKTDPEWIFEKSQKGPRTQNMEKHQELSFFQSSVIAKLTKLADLPLSSIAEVVGCSKSTVKYHQKKHGLR